jgi:site-specific DNA recombinase
VARIFTEYVAGAGVGAIAEGLNRERIPSPSGHDPARNRHRAAAKGAWGKSAIRAILGNPRYTGRQVWNRQRREEILLDVDDVAAGYTGKMRWNDRSDWVWSTEQTHEPLVTAEVFAAAAEQRSTGGHRQAVVKPRRKRTYCLSSLLHCGVCGRRMSGSWNHDQAHYRCGFPTEYAGATGKHPRWVYLRESEVTPTLDGWLLRHFDPENVDATIAAMVAAQAPDDAAAARTEAARRKIVDCDSRLDKYRAALEAGADPVVVGGWIAEVQGRAPAGRARNR